MSDTGRTCRARVATKHSEEQRTLLRIALAVTLTALALLAPLPAAGQDWHSTTYARQHASEDALRVDVEYGAGRLDIAPAPKGVLYRANLRYDSETFTPKVDYRDGRMSFGMESGNVRGRNLKEGHLELRLTPDVPVDLELAFGASDATIELGGLQVSSAKIATGASRTVLQVSSANPVACEEVEIEVGAARFEALQLGNLNTGRFALQGGVGEVVLDFTGDWQRDMAATIDLGLGSLTLRVPTGLGVRITKDGMLAAFDSQRLTKRGDVYYSEDWDTATHKLSIELDAALGSIRVEWVDS